MLGEMFRSRRVVRITDILALPHTTDFALVRKHKVQWILISGKLTLLA